MTKPLNITEQEREYLMRLVNKHLNDKIIGASLDYCAKPFIEHMANKISTVKFPKQSLTK